MRLFEKWWAGQQIPSDISPYESELETAFLAGMLAAADIAQNLDYTTFAHRDTQTSIAIGIREAVKNNGT